MTDVQELEYGVDEVHDVPPLVLTYTPCQPPAAASVEPSEEEVMDCQPYPLGADVIYHDAPPSVLRYRPPPLMIATSFEPSDEDVMEYQPYP